MRDGAVIAVFLCLGLIVPAASAEPSNNTQPVGVYDCHNGERVLVNHAQRKLLPLVPGRGSM
jgi:hypothetical protein